MMRKKQCTQCSPHAIKLPSVATEKRRKVKATKEYLAWFVRNKPAMVAFVAGKKIQAIMVDPNFRVYGFGEPHHPGWRNCTIPSWCESQEYRVKK